MHFGIAIFKKIILNLMMCSLPRCFQDHGHTSICLHSAAGPWQN